MKPLHLLSNAVRAKEIVAILARHGFQDILFAIDAPSHWLGKIVQPEKPNRTVWQRIRLACEDLGPTFIKIAQLLSARPDVLPRALIVEFKQLRRQVKPVPFEQIKLVLEKELGEGKKDVFSAFQETPVASGSIGQVYRARLREGGQEVAVKVQRPGIRHAIESDLDILGWLARKIHDRVREIQPYDLPLVIQETKAGLMRELDFLNEARNINLFNELCDEEESVFAPRVFEQAATSKVLVCEWVDGMSPDQLESGADFKKEIARIGSDSIFQQVMIHGFFHADPHVGNLIITPDRRVCFIDWGLAGQLTRAMRYFLADLLMALSARDAEKVVRTALKFSQNTRRVDVSLMEKQVMAVIHKYRTVTGAGKPVGNLILELIYIFGSNGIHLARDYTILAKSVVTIEEVSRELDPEFDLQKSVRPFLKRLTLERWNPVEMIRYIGWFLSSGFIKLQELPSDIQRVLRRFEEQDLSVNLYHKGLEDTKELLSSSVNRIVLALIIAALIVGSSLIITSGVGPDLWGFPAIGMIGYLISAFFGFWIIIDIIRHGRHK